MAKDARLRAPNLLFKNKFEKIFDGVWCACMRVNLYTDYLFRILMQAAVCHPKWVTVDDVAEKFDISRHYLVKAVHTLGREGYLVTRRGRDGGFTLAHPPADIRVGDIARLGEGGDEIIDCGDRQGRACLLFPSCHLKDILKEAAEAFFSILDRYTLEDLIRSGAMTKALRGGGRSCRGCS